jgi:hypothetical protein
LTAGPADDQVSALIIWEARDRALFDVQQLPPGLVFRGTVASTACCGQQRTGGGNWKARSLLHIRRQDCLRTQVRPRTPDENCGPDTYISGRVCWEAELLRGSKNFKHFRDTAGFDAWPTPRPSSPADGHREGSCCCVCGLFCRGTLSSRGTMRVQQRSVALIVCETD